jgi:transposase-like protein
MGLAAEVGAIGDRPLAEVAYPYVLLDVTDCKARSDQGALPHAVVIATGKPSTATARCRALP